MWMGGWNTHELIIYISLAYSAGVSLTHLHAPLWKHVAAPLMVITLCYLVWGVVLAKRYVFG